MNARIAGKVGRCMQSIITLVVFALLQASAFCDSGGPYEFVPDLKKGEEPPTCAIAPSSVSQTLDFYLNHEPVPTTEDNQAEPTRLTWSPIPADHKANLEYLGNLGGDVYAVRYLDEKRLRIHVTSAHAILIIANPYDHDYKFSPVYFTTGGATEEHDASQVKELGNLKFIWIRRHYSGTARDVERIALTFEDGDYVRYQLFSSEDFWKQYGFDDDGWKTWHRGNWFDEETLTDHFHIFRPPIKSRGEVTDVHARIRVPYKFKNGKLVPKKTVFEKTEW
jgi:hypothetical protein